MEPFGLLGNAWLVLLASLLVAWSLTALLFVALAVLRARSEARVRTVRRRHVVMTGAPMVLASRHRARRGNSS